MNGRELASIIADYCHITPFILSNFKNIECVGYDPKGKNILFFMLPNYGNIGDQAIAFGSMLFLKKYFDNYNIICIDLHDTYRIIKSVKKQIQSSDIIFLQGGGNMGNMYQYIENYRRYIIEQLNRNTIVSFPITCTYTRDRNGVKERNISKKIYNNHKKLYIMTRDKQSYQYLTNDFGLNNVLLCPDMAFFMMNHFSIEKNMSNSILLCLRHDKESVDDKQTSLIIKRMMRDSNVHLYDTVLFRGINSDEREIEIESVLRDISDAKVVITNRMHAMVFCAITGTPCVVMRSLDNKISGCYEWIKELKYVEMLDNMDVSEIYNAMDRVLNAEINRPNFMTTFEKLGLKLRNIVSE